MPSVIVFDTFKSMSKSNYKKPIILI